MAKMRRSSRRHLQPLGLLDRIPAFVESLPLSGLQPPVVAVEAEEVQGGKHPVLRQANCDIGHGAESRKVRFRADSCAKTLAERENVDIGQHIVVLAHGRTADRTEPHGPVAWTHAMVTDRDGVR